MFFDIIKKEFNLMVNYAFTYIIGYRHRQDRILNLRRVLDWINGFSGAQVIVVEQDTHSKIQHMNLKCQHIFVKSKMPYNRSWAFNIGTKYAQSNIVVYGDCDLIMNPNEFIEGLKAIENHDVVSPYRSVIDLTADETAGDFNSVFNINRPGRGENDNQKINLCGGIVIFRKDSIMKIGGWCQEFVGWGGEDDFQTMKVTRLGLTSVEMPYRVYHLWHEREQPNMTWYQRSLKILNDCANMDDDKLKRFIGNSLQTVGIMNLYDK